MPSVYPEKRRTKDGIAYRAVWRVADPTHPTGFRRHTKDFGPYKDLRDDFIIRKREELYAEESGLPSAKEEKHLKEAMALYLDHCRKHKKERTYRQFDKPSAESFQEFVGNLPLKQVTSEKISEWENKLMETQPKNRKGQKGYGTATVAMRLRCVRTAFNFFRRSGWIGTIPTFYIPEPENETGRVVPNHEIKEILKNLSPAAGRAVSILLHTGMRLGELYALQGEDIRKDHSGHWTAYVKTIKRKRGLPPKIRTVMVHRKIQSLIPVPPNPGPIITDITRDALEAEFRGVVQDLELPRTRLHDLRHTAATRYMEKFGDLNGLMLTFGWDDQRTVTRYQHLTRGRSEAILGLDFGI